MDNESEVAVSPVIGVILMVAVTVILAAVIATFVFGMTSNIPSSRTIVVTADSTTADNVVVIYKGGPDAQSFSYALVSVIPSGGGVTTYENVTHASNVLGSNVGSTVIATAPTPGGFTGKDHVLVTARFKDGTSQVVLNSYI
jgi:archaeal type IV pilus assembly protein PilA